VTHAAEAVISTLAWVQNNIVDFYFFSGALSNALVMSL
jgi:hypothetical protein